VPSRSTGCLLGARAIAFLSGVARNGTQWNAIPLFPRARGWLFFSQRKKPAARQTKNREHAFPRVPGFQVFMNRDLVSHPIQSEPGRGFQCPDA
jgi:hypothetical protein